MQDQITSYPNQPVRVKKNYMGIVVVVIIAALMGLFLYFRQLENTDQTKVTVRVTKAPTSTPKPVIDKKSVKIQVLNGTGTPGQAGEAVDALVEAGYNKDNIEADNAEKYDNTVTTVSAKSGFEDVAEDIKEALKDTFDEIEIDSKNLDKDNKLDIIVTTGGKKFEEATPTPLPTTKVTTTPTITLTPTTTLTPTSTPTPTP